MSDGTHLEADTPYAEVEVMKMCMPLLLPASGVIHFVLSEGQPMQVVIFILRNHMKFKMTIHIYTKTQIKQQSITGR